MHVHATMSFFYNKMFVIKLGKWPMSLFLSPLPTSCRPSLLPMIFFSFSVSLSLSTQHSNPGHAAPFPVASLHNANPTSPTSASMAGAHAHCGPASPIIGPIELIPSVTNPENLPCLPEIPPIQVRHVLTMYLIYFFGAGTFSSILLFRLKIKMSTMLKNKKSFKYIYWKYLTIPIMMNGWTCFAKNWVRNTVKCCDFIYTYKRYHWLVKVCRSTTTTSDVVNE